MHQSIAEENYPLARRLFVERPQQLSGLWSGWFAVDPEEGARPFFEARSVVALRAFSFATKKARAAFAVAGFFSSEGSPCEA
ncbi:hypothetical protein [Paracidovorax oryzae]|uniref:hypothetical protein n=1 Tax=Paracidovorax oryzae TaxID=862720 RepID=UPI0035CF32A1